MFQSSGGGASIPPSLGLPSLRQEAMRHILLGDRAALLATISRLAVLGYCETLAWSDPLPTGRSDECISVMTRKRTIP
ncbi:MAG: hypothetical protein F6K42_21290 [Leptolyngbya sp. SIO1D8]|nr:hypothetical protein [Leptolyngbya sp. SIO1D8]